MQINSTDLKMHQNSYLNLFCVILVRSWSLYNAKVLCFCQRKRHKNKHLTNLEFIYD